MKTYILGMMVGLCMFYVTIGEQDRMSRAIDRRVEIPLLIYSPAGT